MSQPHESRRCSWISGWIKPTEAYLCLRLPWADKPFFARLWIKTSDP